jgi:hypothetical protein
VRRTVAALRRGRAALESIEQQLGDLIAALAEAPASHARDADAEPPIARDAPERLVDAVRAAAAALASVEPVAPPVRPARRTRRAR